MQGHVHQNLDSAELFSRRHVASPGWSPTVSEASKTVGHPANPLKKVLSTENLPVWPFLWPKYRFGAPAARHGGFPGAAGPKMAQPLKKNFERNFFLLTDTFLALGTH